MCMHTLTHRLYRYETIITHIDLNNLQYTIICLYNTQNSEVKTYIHNNIVYYSGGTYVVVIFIMYYNEKIQ